ncbi:hypothetical protein XENTR_v10008736 [Xenopus tropicalis]|nr:regulator of DNA class I crossover intermediates 1 [Xenopus tropicalis]XP_031753547.1 uncharacterized protein C12orf40 homolog isoform X2 [Xenopus tropicalis]XP_031753548.1 uncharacterized protein C12orf40 homolog isoform X2 [Xenopus tropicalis]AAI67729.1 LOC100170619 protein [Xenopus tropicalis]KAE8616171.1 hypothetical protein XENTR_v10008736 [Xenopus tropicalis]|eukprot:NP_001123853.1 uncharacterized protein C12orf40 homolog [Xenopus tropicalis]
MDRSGSACKENSSISLDLLNLYFVNQISRKMESTNKKVLNTDIKKPVAFPLSQNIAELPMTPTAVKSAICLEDHEVTCPNKNRLCIDPGDIFEQNEIPEVPSQLLSILSDTENINKSSYGYDIPVSHQWNSTSCFSASYGMLLHRKQNEDMPRESSKDKGGVWQTGQPGIQRQFVQCSPETSEMFIPIEKRTNMCKSDMYDVSNLLSDVPHSRSIRKENQLYVCGKSHAWSQTDSTQYTAEKHDVSVQCDLLQEHKCSECSTGNHSVASNRKLAINIITIRGQQAPLNKLLYMP